MTKFRRAACLWLTGIMAATFVAGNVLAFADTKSSTLSADGQFDTVNFTDVTGKVDVSGVALQNLSKDVLLNAGYSAAASGTQTVIVRLDADSLTDSVPDGESVSDYISSYAGSKKLKTIKESQTNFLNSLSSLGVSYKVKYQYTAVTNAVAIEVDTSSLSAIKSLAHVQAAYLSETYAFPEADDSNEVAASATTNYSNVYATGIYNSSDIIENYGYDGSGMTVAILDTGLDYTHDAFTSYPLDPSKISMNKSYVAGKLNEEVFNATTLSAAKGKNITADDVYVSDKVPFAYDYADADADVYPSYSQHGTHVAGIVAGHADSYKDKDGNLVNSPFTGVAPNAQLVICKVFTDDFESTELGGATTENLVAALDDCVKLGVDVINMSLGTPSGFSSGFLDGDDEGQLLDETYRAVKRAGISLICAASNEYSAGFGSAFGTNLVTNPDSGTVGSPSTFDGAVSVASVNGQQAPFMVANGTTPVFYTESSDSNAVKFDFAKQLLGDKTSETFKYVVVPGIGQEADYTSTIKSLLDDDNYRTIALVRRGTSTFETKIRTAMKYADAIIVYNNVAGTIGMSVGEIDDPIPAVSITLDAGTSLCYDSNGKRLTYGLIEINKNYLAGPFMNEYSSWGATPDLKLKPDVTAHGGEITSTVAGGYDELSGTSMASPNLAGFVALLKSYVKTELASIHGNDAKAITRLVNQILMSTAITVYDINGLPYSPRKQGSGLATLSNAFSTGAYLWTDESNGGAEDDRPKIELGEDEDGVGEYTFSLNVSNFGAKDLDFIASAQLFTETLSSDKLTVAEKAYFLSDIAPVWSIKENGGASRPLGANEKFTVKQGESAEITVTLKLSDAEKNYIKTSFPNGMFVEGFITLKSQTEGQCDLNLPYMGFFGDWESAPMLDYSVYEIAEFQQDKSLTDDTRPKESVWATQAFANYYNNLYSVPMGSYVYTQDESAEQIYASSEHAVLSQYNWYYGEDDSSNYLTTYQIRALYAGLLRNAAVVTYDLSDAETGEIIKTDNVYRLNKAYAGGGVSTPSQVLLEFDPTELGLVNNGKYALDFYFYFNVEQYEQCVRTEDNTFSMTFYVDYEAPVLVDSRIRYVDHRDTSGREWQSVYLDLDIYDNTYAQSVILCVAEYEDPMKPSPDTIKNLRLVTDYITPVYNAVKNGTTTVTIDISDIMSQPDIYNNLYIQIDDYALNHRVLSIDFESSVKNVLPNSFDVSATEVVVGVNETYKVNLLFEGNANASNFNWSPSANRYVKVNNGEIFGLAPTPAGLPTYVTVSNGLDVRTIAVTVVDNGKKLTFPTSLSFGMIQDNLESLVKATGTVKVNAGVEFTLEVFAEPWYYDLSNYEIVWRSTNTAIAEVDQSGNVTVHDTKGSAGIYAEIYDGGIVKASTSVTLAVQDPFTVTSSKLTKYSGTASYVVIPADKNITTIGEEAFKDNSTMEVVIIPSTVTSIDVKAFINCTALKEVYFIQEEAMEIPDSSLATIMRYAFFGCTALEKVDLSNCKTITVDRSVFEGCTSLKTIVKMENIGTMLSRAFYGCTSLEEIDLTGMHVAGTSVFAGCTSLEKVKTGYYTAIGENMFNGCNSLEEVAINAKTVESNAFAYCQNLETVNFGVAENGEKVSETYIISAYAFYNCANLTTINYNGNEVIEIGDMAFANCEKLTSFPVPKGLVSMGDCVFENVNVTYVAATGSGYDVTGGAVYSGNTLLVAPKNVPANFALKQGTTAIAPYAFSDCTFANGTVDLTGVTSIGEGAFAHSNLSSVTLPEGLTEISAYAFAGTEISTVTINKEITSIGAGAFMDCVNLATVTFEDGSELVSIGDAAFYGCEALDNVTLPDGVKTMGSSVFEYCINLTSVKMPSVTSLGAYTFGGCENLEEVTFGENATTVGEFTFAGCENLVNVVIGDKTVTIGNGAFMGCTALEELDLKSVTSIGNMSFFGCSALKADLGKIVHIGDMAFYGCTGLGELNLANVKTVGEGAFYLAGFESLSIPVVESIGNFAFFGGLEKTVALTTTVKTIGYGAFANSRNLTAFTLSGDGETKFFVVDGVLYRIIDTVSGGEDSYELTAYPSAKIADSDEDGIKTYSIIEGTATVKADAMAFLTDGTVEKVIIPYSVKTIGDAAFYGSGISHYQFEAINAPSLLSEFYYLGEYLGTDISSFSHLAMFERNFGDEIWRYVDVQILVIPFTSTLKISYPSNGSGYDNYLYSRYFGTRASLGEIMDDNTRALIKAVESFPSLEEIASWNALPVTDENKTMVSDFSTLVIFAHELYNILASDYQRELFGSENEQTLFDVESALRSVKAHFGITVKATSLSIAESSTHRVQYVAGERFSLKGLVLNVGYEDYSTAPADMSKIIINPDYDKELTTYTVDVEVIGTDEYAGLKLLIPISVSEGTVGGHGAGSSNGLVIGLAVGGSILGLLLIAAAVILVLTFKFNINVIGKIFKKSEKATVTDDGIVDAENINGENKEE